MGALNRSEQEWLAASYPDLLVFERPDLTIIEGPLHFHRIFNGVPLEDTYFIKVELPSLSGKPKLYETDGRIRGVFEKYHLTNKADIHAYSDWSLCFAAPQELKLKYLVNPSVEVLIRDYLEPYFYSQSYFEKEGEWPWLHLPHNAKGLMEWYLDNVDVPGALHETTLEIRRLVDKGYTDAIRIMQRAKRRNSFIPQERCLCGRKKSYRQCHPVLTKLAMALRGSTN